MPSSASVYVYGAVPPLAAIVTVVVPLTVAPAPGVVIEAVSASGGGGGGGAVRLRTLTPPPPVPPLPRAAGTRAGKECGPRAARPPSKENEIGPADALV